MWKEALELLKNFKRESVYILKTFKKDSVNLKLGEAF